MKVWVLTSEYNDYDQHGEYFEAVFAKKPELEDLLKFFKKKKELPEWQGPLAVFEFLLHVQKGGGRMDDEHCWYNLQEVTTEG